MIEFTEMSYFGIIFICDIIIISSGNQVAGGGNPPGAPLNLVNASAEGDLGILRLLTDLSPDGDFPADLEVSDIRDFIGQNGLPEDWGDYLYDYYGDYDSSVDNRGKARDFMGMPMMMYSTRRQKGCFPGTAKVTLDSGQEVKMADLEEGQRVLTATDDGELVYSEVIAFLKRSHHTASLYWRLETRSTTISLTDFHVIFVNNGNDTISLTTKFAKDVQVGEWVLVKSGVVLKLEVVNRIHTMVMEGAYVPLTEHGTILVDGVLASCYASFDHQLANFFLAPLRWWPSLFGSVRVEYDMPAYVYAIKEIGHFILPTSYHDRSHWAANLLRAIHL